ncbi:hypothetical protein [Microcoleus sp. CAWBG24]|uniref:hypothetical protein n=1 Tax=Microcoleus sp. CAWBG24 TaxID=2841644 RepID=UPI0025E6663D|nr:hypothetical protein [Microcoleus sp. CAWBG24]
MGAIARANLTSIDLQDITSMLKQVFPLKSATGRSPNFTSADNAGRCHKSPVN